MQQADKHKTDRLLMKERHRKELSVVKKRLIPLMEKYMSVEAHPSLEVDTFHIHTKVDGMMMRTINNMSFDETRLMVSDYLVERMIHQLRDMRAAG